MNRYRISVLTILLALTALPAVGQVCYQPQYEGKLACVPTLTTDYQTTNWEVRTATGAQPTSSASITRAAYLGTEVPIAFPLGIGFQYASQIATAPSVATASGGIITMKGIKPADFGPLFSDLPKTIGRHRLFVGTSYQRMNISKIGGQPISKFNFDQFGIDNYFSLNYNGNGFYDSVYSQGSASLKTQSVNTYVSFGILEKWEVSAVIPWSQVSFSMNTSCLANNGPGSFGAITFTPAQTGFTSAQTYCASTLFPYPENDYSQNPTNGWYDLWVYNASSSATSNLPSGTGYSNELLPSTVHGVGDVTLRTKFGQPYTRRVKTGDKKGNEKGGGAFAFGLEIRLPTGDPLNFLGSGATGVRPFLAWSDSGWKGRVSPHLNLGWQHNGSSVNDVRDNVSYQPLRTTTSTSGGATGSYYYFSFTNIPPSSKLPNAITYSGGLDIALTKWLNADGDLIGRHFSNNGYKAFLAPSIAIPSLTTGSPGSTAPLPTEPFTGTSDKFAYIFGLKLTVPRSNLYFSANGQTDGNSGSGMSYGISPIFSLSYGFSAVR